MCDIKLTLESEGKDLLMTITPVEGQPKANIKKLQTAFKLSEYSAFLLIDGAMALLLEEVAKANENDEKKENSGTSLIIAHAVDASLTVTIGPENMSVTLELTAGYGGKQIKNANVIEILKENNITKGIIKENLINIVKDGIHLQSGKSITTEIARGKASTSGKDGYIKYLVDDPADRIMCPKKLDNGNVDMRELGDLIHVKTGRKLAKLIPPTAGVNGFDVLGTITDAVSGEMSVLEESDGSSFSDENNNILIATIDGMPKHLDNSVTVNTLLEVENIDVGTGNIRFDGSIYVKGNVCEGMELSASEDIVIGGIVESASIAAGGNISIALGIIGRQVYEDNHLENNTVLQAEGDVSAQFVQYADIFAKNDIKVTQYISHSQIIVEGDLWVGNIANEKADGKVFGTSVLAGGSVRVGTLGSRCGAMTNLNLNYWVNTAEELKISASEKADKIMRRLPRIYKLLRKANNLKDENTQQIDRINQALQQHLNLLGKLNKNWLEKESTINKHLETFELSVYKSILSGVNIEVSNKTCAFKRDHEAAQVKWLENKISVEPIVN
ncbi:MAG: FapA family protein [Cocleimonas sp.]